MASKMAATDGEKVKTAVSLSILLLEHCSFYHYGQFVNTIKIKGGQGGLRGVRGVRGGEVTMYANWFG